MKPVKRIWIYISVFIVISILLFIFLWNRKESLEDIAPTILDLMGIEKPKVMTGNSLIILDK